MRNFFLLAMLIGCASAYLVFASHQNLRVVRNDVVISINAPNVRETSLLIAVIGDPHLPEGKEVISAFHELLLRVKSSNPDLVVFVGDYIADPSSIADMPKHRELVINAFKLVDPIPRAVVLGNYENWSNAHDWFTDFKRLGVEVLENQVAVLETKRGFVCVRGLGDKFTNRFEYVDYPRRCNSLPKLTLTHDPAGSFDPKVEGLVIAGHTHCGQVNVPFFGPLWVPTDAPPFAHCGLYQSGGRAVFVTSGVGTSILPIRFGTQSGWDLIDLNINIKG